MTQLVEVDQLTCSFLWLVGVCVGRFFDGRPAQLPMMQYILSEAAALCFVGLFTLVPFFDVDGVSFVLVTHQTSLTQV